MRSPVQRRQTNRATQWVFCAALLVTACANFSILCGAHTKLVDIKQRILSIVKTIEKGRQGHCVRKTRRRH